MSNFSVRRVEDPTIYVRRNKSDILGSAWDNIADFKDALNRLEDNVAAADIRQKPVKKSSSYNGPVLKEISSETQHFGKVTRFQLLGEKSDYKGLPKHSVSAVEIKTRRNNVNHSKPGPDSDISSIKMDTYSKLSQGASGRNGYSPNRYTVNGLKSGGRIHEELPSFFKTTTVNPVILNDSSLDSNHNKESSFINTTVNSSVNSHQFSLSSSPSFHGKAVLAKNEGALQKIKEKVQKQKAMLSKPDEKVSDQTDDRKLHDSKDEIATPTEVEMNQVPLKRKVGTVSLSGPTYRGFNSVSGQKTTKKGEKRKLKVQHSTVVKSSKEGKGLAKPVPKPENKLKKARMNRIISSRCPKEVISTTSWRDGQATVKKILGSKKSKAKSIPDNNGVPAEKADTTYNVIGRGQDELSEGKLSDEDSDFEIYNPKDDKIEKEVESNMPKMNEVDKHSEISSHDADVENEEKLKDVLSTEAQSMLVDLAQDSSESECEMKEEEEEKPKSTEQSKKAPKSRKSKAVHKPTVEEKYSKEKSRHYDQTEVQKYMAQQMAERKKKQKQEKILKKKQEEEKQRRLKDLYARQKKSFAGPKKEKRFGQTFTSTDNEELRIPGHEVYGASPDEYEKFDQRLTPNESDKENTDVNDVEKSSEASFDHSIDATDDDNILTDDISSVNEQAHDRSVDHVMQPAPSLPLNQRAQRLTALRATALALQSRLQSQALRLSGGTSERMVSQPISTVVARPKDEETGFQGALPGVANIRKQAHANERQSTRVEAATKIQAAYRGHTVRKRFHWHDGNDVESDENSVVSSIIEKQDNHMRHDDDDDEQGKQTEGSADDIEYRAIRPLYKEDILNDLRTERTYFRHADTPAVPFAHFSLPSVQYEPRGDRYSVMNIFTRRHPTIAVEDILDERPGSETASLLDAGGVSRKSDGSVEYEDDFTDEDISTASVLTEQDLNKESPSPSKPETYSECGFESDEEQEELEHKDSTLKENVEEQLSERSRLKTSSPLSSVADVVSPENKHGDDIIPIMTSTMHPDHQRSRLSISLSDYSEPLRQPLFIRPVQHTGGDRFSPDSLQRKLTAEINLLENVEDSVRQVNDIEKTRVVSLAQQDTVSLAQFLKQNHEQEMQNLRLKAKDEAIQAAKDLEKTRQAAATAAASAAEKLAEVQNEAMKANAENSRKYVEEASKVSSGMLSSTAHQLAEFCKSVTATTSAAVQDLHTINRPTTTLVERATSFSEGHAIQSENSSKSDEHTRTSDVYSNQSKSWATSPSVTSGRQQGGYSSDEFESDKSRAAGHEISQIKTEPTRSASLSVESIPEDLADKSASDGDTTINEESANDTQSLSTEKAKHTDKVHRSVSPFLDYSSQFEDSSHALTDDDIDFRLFPSREHRRRSMKRIKDNSFDEGKGKRKVARTPFESDDSFGKFTVDMIQQYMKEEEVRTRHQGAILRLREKSLKEKTNAELQWLEQLKKQSRDKGSDDVMPSIKKRERGILMKLKAEKEEIKCLKAANRAASFQRRFMIYQQQEIHRLHQATMNIREKIQKNVSKKSSPRSSYEASQEHPKTSSPMSKTASNTQRSQSDSLSKANKTSTPLRASPSAKSVSEDINEEEGTSHASPVVSASSFPSYSTPKSETSKEVPQTQQAPTEPETSTILNMLSFLESGEQELSNENGERLLKIHKMLVERQQKLVKDESEVNSILQKVTEMINNQRNVIPRSSHGNHTSESARTPATISDVKQTKDDPSELSIPEDLSSVEEIISEEIKENSEKSASDYANCTFDTDETATSRHSTLPQASKQSSEVQIDEEPLSLTETSDHSDYEERIRKLKEEIQREKMKADALEKKKRKLKRSAMRKEVLNLEKELKNTRDDIHRKMAEIKTVGAVQASTSPSSSSSVKSNKSSVSSQKQRPSFAKRENGDSSLRKTSERATSAQESSQTTQGRSQTTQETTSHTTQETSHTSSGRDATFESSVHEVDESLIEILGSPRASLTLKDTRKASARASPGLDQNQASDVPEEISEHLDSDSRSATSISEGSGIANGEQLSSKASDIPEEISEMSYTEPRSSTPSISEEIPSIVEDIRDSHGKTPDDEFEHSYTTEPQSDTSIPEDPERSDEKIPGGADDEFEHSYTEPRSNTSIPDEKAAGVSDSGLQHSGTERRSKTSVSKCSDEKTAAVVDEVPEHAYNEPRASISPTSRLSRDLSEETSGRRRYTNAAETTVDEELDVLSEVWNISVVSENSPAVTEREDHRSENVLSQKESHDVIISENGTHDVITSEKESYDVIISENELRDIITSEKSVPENSISSVKRVKNGEKKSESSESSSIAEEIASGYEDEESQELIFGDLEKAHETKGGVKESANEEYADTFTQTSRATAENTSPKGKIEPCGEDKKSLQSGSSESKLLSARELGTKEKEERAGQESEDEKQYSEDFEVDDATISEDIPEILESDEEQVESDNENNFKVFISDGRGVRGTRDESEARGKGVLDDITDDIYRGVVEDSLETVRSAKDAKSRRITEQQISDEALEGKEEKSADEVRSRSEKINTDSITKDLLADAILQMIAIKRWKKDAGKTGTTVENEAKHVGTQNDFEPSPRLFPGTPTSPTDKSPTTKPPSATGPLGVIPGFDSTDEQSVFNALQIAKSNQALDDDALKTMDEDIEGLLGVSGDDYDDEDEFPVNQNKFNDIALDDTEPSIHEYPPMFAVPHQLQEITSIANSAVDILLEQKREEMPLENCEPPAQMLGGETENELASPSIRSYRNLIFDLTKEVFMDTISQDEVATRPPWAKAKWKGGQKLSRNFRRWKSDEQVRAMVVERVSNLIGLGAPRTTMQTLQRKTPVRGNKKDNVDAILIEELRQEEPQWTDYEEDETTVKFQVADAILNMLLDDTVRVFNAIQAKKNVPDNVLVV